MYQEDIITKEISRLAEEIRKKDVERGLFTDIGSKELRKYYTQQARTRILTDKK